jgi:ABC-type transport system involved in cytochrome c biogenesis permease subunit
MFFEKITLLCFGASYAVNLLLELWYLLRPRPVYRFIGLGFGFAGFTAHTLYLFAQKLTLASQQGTVLFLAWILAIFYLYGTLHHRRVAWGVFVLPVVTLLVVLAALTSAPAEGRLGNPSYTASESSAFAWRTLHTGLLILAAVGGCVAFFASIMYLVQAHQLKLKLPFGKGMKLMSLERLEMMNRRAFNLAFPLLTAGLLVGLFLKLDGDTALPWLDPRVIAAFALWLVFAILAYFPLGFHVRGRNRAMLTIVAFALLLVTMAWNHTSPGGGP